MSDRETPDNEKALKSAEQGVADETTFEWIDVDRLDFDSENPRFLLDVDGTDDQAVFKFMIQDAGIVDLIRSIASQGFFPGEPILVAPNGERFTVIEGNRRLAATRLIRKPELAPSRVGSIRAAAELAEERIPQKLPALIFRDRDSILRHLGYRHITGIKEWSPLAKARFLESRYKTLDLAPDAAFKELARSIGSRSDYVARLMTANQLFSVIDREHYFGIQGLSESSIDFSLVYSLLAYSSVVEYLGLSSSADLSMTHLKLPSLTFLTRFVFEKDKEGRTRLRESRNIGRLAAVISHEAALRELVGGASLEEAEQVLGTPQDAITTLLTVALTSLQRAVRDSEGVQLLDSDSRLLDMIDNEVAEIRKLAIGSV